MSTLFVSHSSRDHDAVVDFQKRLGERGYRSLFIDFDPQLGIAAGRDWEQELYRQLKLCRALVALLSDHWLASRWCFAELTQARALGKPVFPVRIADCETSGLLADRQVVDVAGEGDGAWERLWIGLKRAGLDPRDVFERDPSRAPYPGLDAFEPSDAAVYFGREAEVAEALEALQRMRRRQEPRLLAVLGASGSGKSSLVRAGVLPRLVKDAERWVALPPFRPGDDPGGALARAFAEALGPELDWKEIRDRLQAGDGAAALRDLAHDLASARGQADAAVLVVVDQFDELLGEDVSGAAAGFLRRLREALGGPLYALLTLRSDFLGAFQKHPELRDLAFANLTLGPMPMARFPQVVEGPAERAGIEIEAGLVGRMVEEAETDDALPLLAFTLREMWEREAARRQPDELHRFTADDYEALGGIRGAVARAADDVLGEKLDDGDEKTLRSAFLKMVRINEEGRYARRPVRLGALPDEARKWVDRFAGARLLVIRGDGGEATVEVAHEALFRVWGKLVGWLAEERELLLWRQRLRAAEKEWQRTGRDASALLRGTPLAEAERWLAERGGELEDADRDFVGESTALRQRQEAERQQLVAERERRRRLQVRAAVAAAAIFLALAALAGLFWQRSENERRLVMARQLASQAALVGGDRGIEDGNATVMRSILLAAESLRLAPTREGHRELVEGTRGIVRRPAAPIPAEGKVHAVAFSADGRLLATGGEQLRLWDPATFDPVSPTLPGDGIRALAFDPLGRWIAAGGEDHRIRVWKLDAWTEVTEPIETRAGPVRSLAVSPDGSLLAVLDKAQGVLLIATDGWRYHRALPTLGLPLAVAFAPDRPWLAVASMGEAVLLDTASGRELAGFRDDHDRRFKGSALALRPAVTADTTDEPGYADAEGEPRYLVAAIRGAGLYRWIVEDTGGAVFLGSHKGFGRVELLASSGERWVTADRGGSVWIGSEARLSHDSTVGSVALSPDGNRLATADGRAWLWDELAPRSETAVLEHDSPVIAVVAGPSEPWLATADRGGALRIFRVPPAGDDAWHVAHRIAAAGAVTGLALSPDGAWLAVAGDRIRILATENWRIALDEELPDPRSVPIFAPGGRWLVLGRDRSHFLELFEVGTWRRMKIPMGPDELLDREFHLSPDGERLALKFFRYRTPGARIWNLATHQEEPSESEGGFGLSQAWPAVSYEEESSTFGGLFEAREEGSGIELLDPVTHHPMTRLDHGAGVNDLAVTSDGRWLLSAGADGLVKVWPLRTDDLVADACSRVPRNLTRTEWAQFVGEAEPYRLTCSKLGEP